MGKQRIGAAAFGPASNGHGAAAVMEQPAAADEPLAEQEDAEEFSSHAPAATDWEDEPPAEEAERFVGPPPTARRIPLPGSRPTRVTLPPAAPAAAPTAPGITPSQALEALLGPVKRVGIAAAKLAVTGTGAAAVAVVAGPTITAASALALAGYLCLPSRK